MSQLGRTATLFIRRLHCTVCVFPLGAHTGRSPLSSGEMAAGKIDPVTLRRRDFVRAAGMAAVTGRLGAEAAAPSPAGKPRYWMIVLLGGGIDGLLTVDPKRKRSVEPWVEVPFDWNEVSHGGGLALGPAFAPLAPMARTMAVLQGVAVNTANHQTGCAQFLRMRLGVTRSMPSFLDLLSRHSAGQPLGQVTLGSQLSTDVTSGWMGGSRPTPDRPSLLEQLETTTEEERRILTDVWQNQAASLQRKGASAADALAADNLLRLSSLFKAVAHVLPLKVQRWFDDPDDQLLAAELQRALWLFENDLTSGIYLRRSMSAWDTHAFNVPRQAALGLSFSRVFARFLSELEQRKNPYGRLSESTAIVAGSELGRHPRTNSDLGKDHFPEAPLMFFGPAFRTAGSGGGSFGETGRQMEASAVDLRTGQKSKTGKRVTLDDVGATLLRVAGIDPRRYGYTGTDLPFLSGPA
jgi:hypothetical protein